MPAPGRTLLIPNNIRASGPTETLTNGLVDSSASARPAANTAGGRAIFIAASENDPCSNALVEALACGLPAVYRDSGGHGELAGGAGLGLTRADEIPDLLQRLGDEYERYQDLMSGPLAFTQLERFVGRPLEDTRKAGLYRSKARGDVFLKWGDWAIKRKTGQSVHATLARLHAMERTT